MRSPIAPTEQSASTPGTGEPDRRPGAIRAWDAFFFTPADPTPLGLVRIAVGLLLIWDFAWLGVDLSAWLGPDGWAGLDAVRATWRPGAWSFWTWVPDSMIGPVYAACLVVMVLFTLGLGTRATAALAWVAIVSTNRRVPVMLFGFDNMIATWTLYLAATGAAGQALSLDRLIARRRGKVAGGRPEPTVSANLALRLLQLHLCLVYASAGLAKLQGTPWWDGSAVGMLLGNSEFATTDLSGLVRYPKLLQLATHGTIAVEILYPVLVWFGGWRPWMIAGAVGMHLGIAASMGLTEFSVAMIAANLAFVPARWLHALGRLGRGLPSAPRLESQGSSDAPPSPAEPRGARGHRRDRERPPGRPAR